MPAEPALNSLSANSSSTSGKVATPFNDANAQESHKPEESAKARLHITPFTPALLKVYLNPTVLPLATNISYHTVSTFPEKGFGYIDLPIMEAQKLKKKLKGSILKGSKVQIEDAKPEKRKSKDADAEKEDERPVKRAKQEKKKKEQGVLEGIELPDDRKVKRGWTEPAGKARAKLDKQKKKEKKEKRLKQKESKYTKEPELLFKTKLTPVATNALEASSKDGSKDKKKDKKKSGEVIVHEFENNRKQPSFLKSAPVSTEKKPAVEYVDGKGWVDEDGNVVEAETGKARNRRQLELVDDPRPVRTQAESEDKSKSKSKTKTKKQYVKTPTPPPTSSEESSSADESSSAVSSDSDSDSASDSDGSEARPQALSSPVSPVVPTVSLQSVTITPPSPSAKEEESKDVHPLEALFKRPKPPSLGLDINNSSTPMRLAPLNTSFSFFDGDNGEEMDVEASGNNPPATPFTRKDMEWRGQRSAAPTPDTAAIDRRFSFPWGRDNGSDEDSDFVDEAGGELSQNTKANAGLAAVDEGDEDEDDDAEEVDANSVPLGAKGKEVNGEDEQEESAFSKWFWENRGDNNRAWKRRRREALKVKRQRENKRIGGRRIG